MRIAVYWCPLVAVLRNGSQRAALPHQRSPVEISFWAGLLQSRQAGEERLRGEVSQQRPLTLSKVPTQCKAGQSSKRKRNGSYYD